MRLSDYTESLYVSVLGNNQGEEIIGMPAVQLKELCESDPQYQPGNQEVICPTLLDYLEKNCQNKMMTFLISARLDNFMGQSEETRIRYNMTRTQPLNIQ